MTVRGSKQTKSPAEMPSACTSSAEETFSSSTTSIFSQVRAVVEYFGLPFVSPIPPESGVIRGEGPVPLRAYPTWEAPAVTQLFEGDPVTVLGRWMSWVSVETDSGQLGFLPAQVVAV